jgi:hypothetical protein
MSFALFHFHLVVGNLGVSQVSKVRSLESRPQKPAQKAPKADQSRQKVPNCQSFGKFPSSASSFVHSKLGDN